MNKKKINLCEPNVFGNEIKYLNRSIKYNQLATGNYINKLDLAKKLFEFDVEVNLNEINRTN